MGEPDLGRPLATIEERDVDLFLLEEFQVCDEFVEWFCARIGLSEVEFREALHSVADADGETDLVVVVRSGSRRVAVLIENKIDAPEQHRQGERYHQRAYRYRETGKADDYVTVMCAPQRYLDHLPGTSAYQHFVPYEVIADWFAKRPGRRAAWRQYVMQQAVEKGRRGYSMVADPAATTFHKDYWEHLRQCHPQLIMERPGSTPFPRTVELRLWTSPGLVDS